MKHRIRNEFVRNPYNYDPDLLSDQTGLKCEDESLAQQQYMEEADINYITDRFMKTGQLPQVINMPTQGDFAGTFDFQSSMNLLIQAQQEFMSLPAKLRSRFDNDPAKLIEFLDDENNREEAIQIGLLDKDKTRRTGGSEGKDPQATQPQQDPAGTSGQGDKPAAATVEKSTP